jgi:hypothetical protein
MFLTQLFEALQHNVLVIYPGRFQPFHKGHKAVYDHLVQKYGSDSVYISTSDKVDPPKSPFNFKEKQRMMKLTGINPSAVLQSKQPYQSLELVNTIDKNNTVLLFAVSEKDMAEDDPRFTFKPKKDGSPAYLQAMPNDLSEAHTADKHAYITTVPTMDFTVLGNAANSATEIRAMFADADEETKKLIITDLFGKYSKSIEKLMTAKITTEEAAMHINEIFEAGERKDRPEDDEHDHDHKHTGSNEHSKKATNALVMAMNRKAQIAHPEASTPEEALTLYIISREKKDIDRLDNEKAADDERIAQLGALEMKLENHVENLQQQIDNLTDTDNYPDNLRVADKHEMRENAAGVGVIAKNAKQAKDPRYSMSMTNDVRPGTDVLNRKALKLEALQKVLSEVRCLRSTLK